MVANPPITKNVRAWLAGPFLALYALLGIYYSTQGVAWAIDAWLSLAFLSVVVLINRWLQLGVTGFLLLNIPLLTHNLGALGLYDWQLGVLAYDNLQHLLSSAVAAYIIFHFLARKLHIKQHTTKKHTVVDDQALTLIVLVIAGVGMLGAGIELLEFGGYVLLGPGEGIAGTGSGDTDTLYGADGQYVDTMTDIIFNTLGTIIGSLAYYLSTYQRKPWMHYA